MKNVLLALLLGAIFLPWVGAPNEEAPGGGRCGVDYVLLRWEDDGTARGRWTTLPCEG